jgi:hypothetical protein
MKLKNNQMLGIIALSIIVVVILTNNGVINFPKFTIADSDFTCDSTIISTTLPTADIV